MALPVVPKLPAPNAVAELVVHLKAYYDILQTTKCAAQDELASNQILFDKGLHPQSSHHVLRIDEMAPLVLGGGRMRL